ncbi:DASH complex subunit Ask1-domain-containing protein [Schizophyllum amplum]|uniref:DASH complex subunit ASK1 n=1 Tax=Schizophyllum amplum TaxID=97359 RepID=A0A550C9X2_9AGAR|nr:DASH complex subunit Ask1-domain-containing protein [Auriculariopsis ampla]
MAELPPRKPIRSLPPRWRPNPNPESIEVPGLDTTASVTDQIEQIEQLITLKLQNIDENFATIHSLLMNKVLPAIKRYGTATEPAREAAKFWTSFYEQAAQIRIPAYDDYETVHDEPSERGEASTAPSEDPAPEQFNEPSGSTAPKYDQSMASTEMSFAPAQAAVSSTPARQRADMADRTQMSDDSWTASVESPLVRMSRDLRSLAEDEEERSRLNATVMHERTFIPASAKGKEREQPLLHNIMRNKTYTGDAITSGLYASPSRSRQKIKTPQVGISTPQRERSYATGDDSDDDDLPPGMSPPVLMSPARAPRSVRRTPGRMAMDRITRDLVTDVQRAERGYQYGYSTTESSVSSMPSVPSSLSRYHQQPSESSDTMDATVQPGAAFMLASAGQGDDSFDSTSSRSSSDSVDDDVWVDAGDDDSDSDSDDDGVVQGDTSTLFGAQGGMHARQSVGPDGNLRMLGEELLEDTIGYVPPIPGMVPESPSPAGEWPMLGGRHGVVDE